MTDQLAGQEPEDAAPAEVPAVPAPDIEARLTQMQSQLDERVKGFQRSLNEKDAALKAAKREADELRMSGMSEDEKAGVEWQRIEDENARLRQENELLSLQSEYPEEMPEFRKILAASTPKEQLDLIRALRAVQAKAAASQDQTSPAEGEPEIPDVDPNNPARSVSSPAGTFNGQQIDENWADRILASVKRMPRT